MRSKYLQVPDEEQREQARKEVNSTAESVKRDVQILIEWLEKQPHLPNFNDEDVLSHCLLNCKNSLEKAKQRLEMYFNTKASLPEVFRDRKLFEKELEYQKDLGMFVPLRKLTSDGYRVVMLYLSEDARNNTNNSTMNNFFKINQLSVELLGKFDYPKGVIVFMDAENISMSLVAAFSSHVQKFILLGQKAIPVRYKKMYFCNVAQACEILLSIGKSLVKKELADRIEILKNPSDICNFISKEIIPSDYGGDELSLRELKDLWFKEMKKHNDYLISVEKYSADLSKLPKDCVETELSGVTGSFRKISVD